MLENLRLPPALVLFFSFSFFHLCFFLRCRKVSRREVGEEAQKILIFTLQKEELRFKNLMLGPSPSPQCPGHLIVWPRLSSGVSKGAEGWEGVGLSALHGELWGASLPGRENPLSGWVNVDHQQCLLGYEATGFPQPPKFRPTAQRGWEILAGLGLCPEKQVNIFRKLSYTQLRSDDVQSPGEVTWGEQENNDRHGNVCTQPSCPACPQQTLILEHLPSPMSLPAKLFPGLYTSLRLPRGTMTSQNPRAPRVAVRQCCGWALGDQGRRDQHLAMDAWMVVAGYGSSLGSLHDPGEVPNTLCSYQ